MLLAATVLRWSCRLEAASGPCAAPYPAASPFPCRNAAMGATRRPTDAVEAAAGVCEGPVLTFPLRERDASALVRRRVAQRSARARGGVPRSSQRGGPRRSGLRGPAARRRAHAARRPTWRRRCASPRGHKRFRGAAVQALGEAKSAMFCVLLVGNFVNQRSRPGMAASHAS